MQRQVLIIHGWSDTSKSFHPLSRFLSANNFDPVNLWLGDYISRDDDVHVSDVGKRMGQVIEDKMAKGELEDEFDVIAHSTGGLVVREWLTTSFAGAVDACPMKRFIMLAPANYGSKLAATGKSMLGRIVKGYDNWFQTGQGMLDDLELASPYQWELAQRDVLIGPQSTHRDSYYGEKQVWPFVIVGTHPYADFLRQIANEDGSDGTVRVCAANLNAQGVTINLTAEGSDPVFFNWENRITDSPAPLAVLPTRTHGSIVDPVRSNRANKESIIETETELALLGKLILEALNCRSFEAYKEIQESWDTISKATATEGMNRPEPDFYHQYMQANFNVVDDAGRPVSDYFLEFFSNKNRKNDNANVYLHQSVVEDVKVNSQNSALRNVYFDRTDLTDNYYPLLPNKYEPILYLSIAAAAPGRNVSYATPSGHALPEIAIHNEDPAHRWMKRNSTHFVKIILPRQPTDSVFKLNRFVAKSG